jgi:ABC-type phosphate transport system auxiliary subunit
VVKFFAEGKKEVIKTIDEVKNADSFIVTEWNESTDNLFVYGKKVTDFRAIDFDQITAVSVGAIQELSKQIQKLQLENAELNKLINNKIQAKQSELEKRLLQLELKLNKKKR